MPCDAPVTITVFRSLAIRLAQRFEPRAHFTDEDLRLFPGRKVAAFVDPVLVNEFGIRTLCPAPRGWIEFVREDAHGTRDGDAFRIEIPFARLLPIETSARKRCVRQPGDRDVVEDVVAREAFGLSVEHPCNQLVASPVVIKEISRQADG